MSESLWEFLLLVLSETCLSCLNRACAHPPVYIGFKAFLSPKALDGLNSARWGGTEQNHKSGYCVPHSPQASLQSSWWWKLTMDEKILFVMYVMDMKLCVREAQTWKDSCSSFHPQAYQTLMLSSPYCHVDFTKDYAPMCSVCQMMTKAWSVIYARVFIFSYITYDFILH